MINDAICAELPSPELDSDGNLIKLMQELITHKSCESSFLNAFCITFKPDKTGLYCIKHFLKHFCSETIMNEDGYPEYH